MLELADIKQEIDQIVFRRYWGYMVGITPTPESIKDQFGIALTWREWSIADIDQATNLEQHFMAKGCHQCKGSWSIMENGALTTGRPIFIYVY